MKANAHFTVVDAMELALLTGRRPADVLKFKRTDIRDGALWIIQNKTGARLGIEITGELAEVITRINARPKRAISAFLIQDENSQPLTQGALCSRFDKARTQGCDRHRQPGALTEAAGTQEPGNDRALR